MTEQSNVSSIPELSDFDLVHSTAGQLIIVRSSFVDKLAVLGIRPPRDIPDQTITIRLRHAKKLIAELQKCVDYIEAGIEHPSRVSPD